MSNHEEQTPWSREIAEGVIKEWRQNGLSMMAFAERHGYKANRIWYWKRRIPSDSKPASNTLAKARSTN